MPFREIRYFPERSPLKESHFFSPIIVQIVRNQIWLRHLSHILSFRAVASALILPDGYSRKRPLRSVGIISETIDSTAPETRVSPSGSSLHSRRAPILRTFNVRYRRSAHSEYLPNAAQTNLPGRHNTSDFSLVYLAASNILEDSSLYISSILFLLFKYNSNSLIRKQVF